MKKFLILVIVVMFSTFIFSDAYIFISRNGWTPSNGLSSMKGQVTHCSFDLDSEGYSTHVEVSCVGSDFMCYRIDGNILYVDPVVPGPIVAPINIEGN